MIRSAGFAVAVLCATTTAAFADPFWDHWGDGKAELDGYSLIQPRYGAQRNGQVVLIFVTEDFSDALRVKADPGKHPASDVYPVFKLNQVRKFQTGIYDYSVLASTFVRADSLAPVKLSFSAQEWCGHVYQQWLFRDGKMIGVGHSYFDGEADSAPTLAVPQGGVVEEQIPILVRGLRGDWLKPGESRKVPYLPSAMRARFAHQPQAWGEATIARAALATPVASVLGRVPASVFTVASAGVETRWTVEDAPPHRILAWDGSDGESAHLTGSTRQPYWQEHDNGDEKYLKLLALPPPRAPKR